MSNYHVTTIDCEQGTQAWLQARAGLLTGSKAKHVVSKGKANGDEPVGRRDYRLQLVAERLTGQPQGDTFVNAAMRHGNETEHRAVAAYEALTSSLVMPVGFMRLDHYKAGCSPDGLVNDGEGLIEVKCPKTSTHIGYLRQMELPRSYVAQVTHNLWVSGAKWCDFVSFDDRLPPGMQLMGVRVTRDDLNVEAYVDKAELFLVSVEKELSDIKTQFADALKLATSVL